MDMKHNKHHCIIVNQGGKNIGYQPNAGVQIMEADGYGFKDLNGSGRLDAFEDWRLPLKARVEDFSQRFGLSQQGDAICSDGKMVGMQMRWFAGCGTMCWWNEPLPKHPRQTANSCRKTVCSPR